MRSCAGDAVARLRISLFDICLTATVDLRIARVTHKGPLRMVTAANVTVIVLIAGVTIGLGVAPKSTQLKSLMLIYHGRGKFVTIPWDSSTMKAIV
jgi:hypothetical protein